jgi:transcriptional regulator with XRE-family HTH domain
MMDQTVTKTNPLPRGETRRLARELGITHSLVSRVARGEQVSRRVTQAIELRLQELKHAAK